MEKDWKSCKLAILSHSEPLWWGKIGKVVNRVKLAVLSHSESLQWEKCYIVGLGPNCKFIDLLFKCSVLIFIKISSFIVSLFQKLFTVRQTHSQKN